MPEIINLERGKGYFVIGEDTAVTHPSEEFPSSKKEWGKKVKLAVAFAMALTVAAAPIARSLGSTHSYITPNSP